MAAKATGIDWLDAPPTDGSAGAALPTFAVAAYDDFGNPTLGGTVTLTATDVDTGDAVAISSGATATIVDDPDAGGRALFDSTVINRPGTYTLTAKTEDVSITSDPFAVGDGAPAFASFSGEPATGWAGWPLSATVSVAVTDAGGNPVPSGMLVTLEHDGDGDGLQGNNAYTDADGVAAFDGVVFVNEGEYTLHAVVDGTELSGSSAQITVTAPPEFSQSSPPTDVTAAIEGDHIHVTWGPPADDGNSVVTGYIVSVRDEHGTEQQAYVDAETFAYDADSSMVTGLDFSRDYTVHLTAQTTFVYMYSLDSEFVAVLPTEAPASTPTNVHAVVNSDQSMTVSWDDPHRDFVVQVLDASGQPIDGESHQVSGNTFTWSGGSMGTTYKFSVHAYNAIGAGPESEASNGVAAVIVRPVRLTSRRSPAPPVSATP